MRSERRQTHLLVIGDREALVWVLKQRRMAFPPNRVAAAQTLRKSDRLLLYTTRGCFHNPTRDRGQIVGELRVRSTPSELRAPVELAGRTFTYACDLSIESLAARGEGVELAPLVEELETFPDPVTWSARMRRPLVPLAPKDATKLRRLFARRLTGDIDDVIGSYVTALPGRNAA